jgi:hypothetical protein
MLLSEEDDSVDGGEAAGGEANEDRRCGRDVHGIFWSRVNLDRARS